jgi:hypothetical protein
MPARAGLTPAPGRGEQPLPVGLGDQLSLVGVEVGQHQIRVEQHLSSPSWSFSG